MIGHELLIDDQLRSQPPDVRQEEPDRLGETGDCAEPRVGLVGMRQLVEQAQLAEALRSSRAPRTTPGSKLWYVASQPGPVAGHLMKRVRRGGPLLGPPPGGEPVVDGLSRR